MKLLLSKHYLTIIFIILLAVMLLSYRFGSDIFSSDSSNQKKHNTGEILFVNGSANLQSFLNKVPAEKTTLIKRGQILQTNEKTVALVKLTDQTFLGLSSNTDVEFTSLLNDKIEIFLKRGRIMITNKSDQVEFVVNTSFTQNSFYRGLVSFVNYDFKDEISVIPFGTEVSTFLEKTKLQMKSSDSINIHESEPVEYNVFFFDPESSSEVDFYQWFTEFDNL
ncbi:MAG: FecR domain-containing protein [Patescibacteria group bacterium]